MSPLYEYRCPECGATQEKLEPYEAPKPQPRAIKPGRCCEATHASQQLR